MSTKKLQNGLWGYRFDHARRTYRGYAFVSKDEAGRNVFNFTFHCLRHTFASHMLGKGVPIYIVAKILGHSSVKTTEEHYGHLDRSVLWRDIHHIRDVMSPPLVENQQTALETAAAGYPAADLRQQKNMDASQSRLMLEYQR